jgi:hypothetical protein
LASLTLSASNNNTQLPPLKEYISLNVFAVNNNSYEAVLRLSTSLPDSGPIQSVKLPNTSAVEGYISHLKWLFALENATTKSVSDFTNTSLAYPTTMPSGFRIQQQSQPMQQQQQYYPIANKKI